MRVHRAAHAAARWRRRQKLNRRAAATLSFLTHHLVPCRHVGRPCKPVPVASPAWLPGAAPARGPAAQRAEMGADRGQVRGGALALLPRRPAPTLPPPHPTHPPAACRLPPTFNAACASPAVAGGMPSASTCRRARHGRGSPPPNWRGWLHTSPGCAFCACRCLVRCFLLACLRAACLGCRWRRSRNHMPLRLGSPVLQFGSDQWLRVTC